MSREAREERKGNFYIPTAEETRELQKLEQEREQRKQQEHMRAQNRQQWLAQQWSLSLPLVTQLAADTKEKRRIQEKAHTLVNLILDECLGDFHSVATEAMEKAIERFRGSQEDPEEQEEPAALA